MEKFDVHILGCGSALPTTRHFPSSQVVNFRDKLFMIDCGEGAQMQYRKCKLKFSRLNHIFISHLHGDHCFGLPGLISSLNLLGRTAELHIHAPNELEALLTPWLNFFCHQMTFEVIFHPFETNKPQLIYEDRSLTVTTIPLKHRMPSCGFLFEEKKRPNHIIREMIDRYDIPLYEINRIKNGADYLTPNGELIPNDKLTIPAEPIRRYAYCSDTLPLASVAKQVKGVNLLFHEATFADDGEARGKETYHTTAKQAARLAQEAGVKQLLIGHFSARYEDDGVLLDEAKSIFEHTQLAREINFYSVD